MTTGNRSARPGFLTTLVLVALFVAPASAADEIAQGVFEAEPVLKNVPLVLGHRLQPHDDGFLLLDRVNHRLLMLDGSGTIKRQIGRVGQAPGELRFPMDYAVGSTGVIRILTAGEVHSIHSFDEDGTFLEVRRLGSTVGEITALSTFSLAVDTRDHVWVNAPLLGAPLAKLSTQGQGPDLIGSLLIPDAVFPECERNERCRDRRFERSLNRASLTSAGAEGVVAAFTAAPVIRRYTMDGELAFETHLRGDLVDELLGVAMQDPESWRQPVSMFTDPVKALTMLFGVAVDPRTGLIYCTVGAKQIYVLSSSGKQVAILKQEGSSHPLVSISVDDGVAWLVGNQTLYRAILPRALP